MQLTPLSSVAFGAPLLGEGGLFLFVVQHWLHKVNPVTLTTKRIAEGDTATL